MKINLILPFGSVTFENFKSLDFNFFNKIRVLDQAFLNGLLGSFILCLQHAGEGKTNTECMPKLQKRKKKAESFL